MFEIVQPRDDACVTHEEPGVLVDVIDHLLNAGHRILENLESFRGKSGGIVVELANVSVQRLGDLDALARARSLRGTAQCVAGAVEILSDRIRRRRCVARRNELTNGGEMTRGFLGVDLVQDGIHGRRRRQRFFLRDFVDDRRIGSDCRWLRRRRRSRRWRGRHVRTHSRQCIGLRHDAADIDCRRASGFELLDELGHRRDCSAQHGHHVGRAIERLVDDAVQQILDGPGELADELSTDHPTAALQRMERTSDVDQRVLILRILIPQWEEPLELLDLVLGLFDEELQELGIDLAIGRLHDCRSGCRRRWGGRCHCRLRRRH